MASIEYKYETDLTYRYDQCNKGLNIQCILRQNKD